MQQQKPRVSIGMPLYNAERYLPQTVDSLLAQTFKDFELIISDNGSTDRTEEICRSYAARDNRILYYRGETNRGAAWNHNRVFELSRGEYFKWATYDDCCAPEFLEKCVSVLDKNPSVVLCYTGIVDIDDDGQFLKLNRCLVADYARPHERFRIIADHDHTCEEIYGLIRSSVLKKTPAMGLYCASDQNLLAELALHGRFHEVPEQLFIHRVHLQSSCRLYGDRRLRTVWFDTSAEGRLLFPYERQFWEYVLLIGRVPLPWRERLRCYLLMFRWLKQYGRETAKSTFWGAYWGAHEWIMVSIKTYMPWVRTAYLALTKPASKS
jgi:glycosyltransferase involved in cell wall biosynthesis